jgi:ATP diphosphatase
MSAALDRLIEVMARLRDLKRGCPWDLEQNFRTIAPYTLEETYEVVEAIEQNDPKAMMDELGDLLFQIIFHAQMGREAGLFDIDQIATHVADKMIERHPHVFGDRDAKTADRVLANWESDKAAKREARAKAENRPVSALDGVTTALPATTRAVKLQNRAARVGFDWTDARDILAKIKEEIGELEAEIETKQNKDAIEDEFGDLFFALINLARRLEVDPEAALRRTNRKFERRFREVGGRRDAQGRKMTDASLEEMEKIWCAVKDEEKRVKKAG